MAGRPTCERRSDDIGDSLGQHDDTVGIGELVHAEQVDEDDGGECVVGADEEAEHAAVGSERRVARQQRHDHGRHAGHGRERVVQQQRVDARVVADVADDHLTDGARDADDGDKEGGAATRDAHLQRLVGRVHVRHVVGGVQQHVGGAEEQEDATAQDRRVQHLRHDVLRLAGDPQRVEDAASARRRARLPRPARLHPHVEHDVRAADPAAADAVDRPTGSEQTAAVEDVLAVHRQRVLRRRSAAAGFTSGSLAAVLAHAAPRLGHGAAACVAVGVNRVGALLASPALLAAVVLLQDVAQAAVVDALRQVRGDGVQVAAEVRGEGEERVRQIMLVRLRRCRRVVRDRRQPTRLRRRRSHALARRLARRHVAATARMRASSGAT